MSIRLQDMRRLALFAAALTALPFAGNALAQEPPAPRAGASARAYVSSTHEITLKSGGKIVGLLTLNKGEKRKLIINAERVQWSNPSRPIEISSSTKSVQITSYGKRTSTFSGNVVIQIEQDGKSVLELKADEATVVVKPDPSE